MSKKAERAFIFTRSCVDQGEDGVEDCTIERVLRFRSQLDRFLSFSNGAPFISEKSAGHTEKCMSFCRLGRFFDRHGKKIPGPPALHARGRLVAAQESGHPATKAARRVASIAIRKCIERCSLQRSLGR